MPTFFAVHMLHLIREAREKMRIAAETITYVYKCTHHTCSSQCKVHIDNCKPNGVLKPYLCAFIYSFTALRVKHTLNTPAAALSTLLLAGVCTSGGQRCAGCSCSAAALHDAAAVLL